MSDVELGVIETRIPSRLDRLPWSTFHWRIVIGLGTAWILDGLEVTVVGSVAARLTQHGSGISISAAGIGVAAALYVVGACTGALVFGHLTDRFGRKKLFLITLGLYMVATALSALSFSAWFFYLFRLLTGAGIGGEYAAINSAIDELIPARARGRIDLVINGSYWIGSIAGSALAIVFLDESLFPADIGWRLTFVLGIVLASAVMLVRRHVPESPRWLFIHGREEEAEQLVDRIERDVQERTGAPLVPVSRVLTVRQRRTIGFRSIVRTAVREYPSRSVLCLALFVGQAFIYNGITFDLGTLMSKFFHVASGITPVFLILYASANFLGPLLLGRMFDTVGRIPMISGTYLGSAVLGLLLCGLFVETSVFTRWTFIVVVMGTFFLASAGASAAYLTASEIFPMETRALSIAFYYAIGTAIGGIAGPLLFGPLIDTGSRDLVGVAFLVGSALMGAGALAELMFGVKAEGRQLEDIAKPLTAVEAEGAPAFAYASANGGAPAASTRIPSQSEKAVRVERLHALAAEHRARAFEHRAAAAEHRAQLHDALASAPAGPEAPSPHVEVEERLARVSEARALADDERAAAAEARAAASALPPAGDRASAGATYLVSAAELRARSHEEQAQALLADDDIASARHRQMAEAALERARAAEQRASATRVSDGESTPAPDGASETDDDGEHDGEQDGEHDGEQDGEHAQAHMRRAMHEAWAQMHEHRARSFELRASGKQERADEEERAARDASERAQAWCSRLEAATFHARATAERDEEAQSHTGARLAGDPWSAQMRRQAADDDERIRARAARSEARRSAGLRRYLPGPGRLGTHPGVSLTPPVAEEVLDHEIVSIERALHDHGPTERAELARLVGARYWGPGVFGEALRQAVQDGAVRRLSRRVYAAATDDESSGQGSDGENPGTRAGEV